jgi:putative transposase
VIRDRDAVYGSTFRERVRALGIEDVVIAPRSPWPTLHVERVIGTLRQECLDHVIVLGEAHLRRIVKKSLGYCLQFRCHLSLEKDAPVHRAVQPRQQGAVIEIPEVGGLHQRYERRAA